MFSTYEAQLRVEQRMKETQDIARSYQMIKKAKIPAKANPSRFLVYIFLCNFAILFVGMGLFPLLPLYAAEFGAGSAMIGIYMAVTYISISVGTMLTGWLSERWSRRRTFLLAGLIGVPALVLLGQASSLWQVVILTSVVWFVGGIGLALANVYTGLFASKDNRGKAFSLVSLASPIGAVIGGLAVGRMVEWQGYPLMFIMLAVVWALWPVVALLKIKEEPAAKIIQKTSGTAVLRGRSDNVFILILLGVLFSALTVSVARLGLSLTMKAQFFTPSQISSATAIGGLVTIPVTLGIGTLSDRMGRKRFLMLSYLVAAIGALTLGFSHQLWHFWIASSLLLAARSSNGSIASALATDLLAPEALGRSLPWVYTMNWVASVIGFAGAGFGIEVLGTVGLLLAATTASIVAAGMLGLLPAKMGIQSVARKQIVCYLPESDRIVTAKARGRYSNFCLVRDPATSHN